MDTPRAHILQPDGYGDLHGGKPQPEGENLKKYFGSLFLLPVEVDGYSAYPGHFLIIQWCWAHILREAENVAISCGADSMAESLHQVLLGLFREAKRIAVVTVDSEGADAQMCIDLKNRVLAVPDMCGDRPFGGTLRNAAPNLFAFLQYLGMPPTNKPPRAAYAMAPCWSARYSRNW